MSNKFKKSGVITISAAHLLHDIYSSFLAPILPLLIDKMSLSLSMSGLLEVIRRLPSLLNPLIGVAADRSNMRNFIIFTPALTASVMSFLGLSPNYAILAILLFVSGISAALFHVPAPIAIKRFSGNRLGKGMSYYMVGGELARTLGPLLITSAVSLWGLEGSFRVVPLGIIATIILYKKFNNIDFNYNVAKKSNKSDLKATLKENRGFLINIIFIIFFRAGIKSSLSLFLPLFLIQEGESFMFAGISLSIFQFSGVAGTLLAGSLSDKIGRKRTILISTAITPLLMWLFIITQGEIRILMMILTGFFMFAFNPVILAQINELKTKSPAFLNSLFITISFSVSSIMIFFVGLLGDHLGLVLTFKICAVLGIFSLPFVFYFYNIDLKKQSI